MAYKKLPGLSITHHRELGKRLKNIEKEHREIINIVQGAYGISSRAGRLVRNSIKLDKLLCELDTLVCLETRNQDWHKECYGSLYLGKDFDEVRQERGLPPFVQ